MVESSNMSKADVEVALNACNLQLQKERAEHKAWAGEQYKILDAEIAENKKYVNMMIDESNPGDVHDQARAAGYEAGLLFSKSFFERIVGGRT